MPLLVFDTANGRREVLPFISAAQVVTEWECPIINPALKYSVPHKLQPDGGSRL